jgi:PAS domain S-box-containing protein
MRVNLKAIFLVLVGWVFIAGLLFGSFAFIAHYAPKHPIPPAYLGPFSLAVATAVCAMALWFVHKLTIMRLQHIRRLIINPDGRSLQGEVKKGDPYNALTEELSGVFARWKSVNEGLLYTQEEELRETRSRAAELKRQNADLTAEVADSRQARAVSQGIQALFMKVFQASPLGMAVMTTREGCFSEVNPRFLDLLGYERDEVVNHSDTELNLWPKAQTRDQLVQQMAKSSALHGVECQLRTKSGELRKVALSLTPAVVHETPCIILTVLDPDDRMRVELELLQTQKMEAVGQLAAGMAHDFNNILMIVQGYTNLLIADPNLDPKSGEALKHVSVAADRAAHLTRQLLAFGRKQMMQPRDVEIKELIEGMSTMLKQLLGLETRLVLEFDSETPSVEADPGMLQEVMRNLAMNARDALSPGGEFKIHTAGVKIDRVDSRLHPEARPGEFLCITVQDNGAGIDPAVLGRIFEPFFTTKEVGKGTGLGLATVYGIVKQHNGWIEVESKLDHGTTFRIYLPAIRRAILVSPTSSESHLAGAETILVVEDEPGLRALVIGILNRYGYTVLAAANGAEALRLWKEKRSRVDLLLTDMVMPEGLSGRALANKLRLEKPQLKVIYTSGYSVDVLSEASREFVEGVNFLQKPYRPQRLAETVRACLAAQEAVTA